jgi:hypothetical protein
MTTKQTVNTPVNQTIETDSEEEFANYCEATGIKPMTISGWVQLYRKWKAERLGQASSGNEPEPPLSAA